MHPDLQIIVTLWEHDHRVDRARERAGALKARIGEIEEEIAEIARQMEAVSLLLGQTVKKEADTQSELNRYIERRDRSARLLEGGQSLDFVAVQKQFEQCSERVDRLEEEVLECMDRRDGLVDQGAGLEAEQERLKDAKGQAHQNWVTEGREIRQEIEEVWPQRQATYAQMNRDLASKYDGFRTKKMDPVAHMGDAVCTACHVVIQGQIRIEVNAGRRLHNCRGCGRWHLPEPEGEE